MYVDKFIHKVIKSHLLNPDQWIAHKDEDVMRLHNGDHSQVRNCSIPFAQDQTFIKIPQSHPKRKELQNMEVVEYAPMIFYSLRQKDNIDQDFFYK
jgi:hypothetical protein